MLFRVAVTLALTGIGCFAQEQTSPSASDQGWKRFDPSSQPAADAGQAGPTGDPAPFANAPATVPPEITIPAGTWITVRVNEPISSKRNHPGDTFSVTLAQPLVADGYVVARRGQSLAGRVAESDAGGRVKGLSHLSLELTDLTLVDGQQMQVRTELARFEPGPSKGRDAIAIGTTTGVGAAIGAAAAGGVGAAAGAGAGAVASTIGVLTTHGRETLVLPEDRLTFRTTAPITISTARAAQVFQLVKQSDYDQPRPVLQRRPGPGPYYGPYGPYWGPYPYYYGPGFYGGPFIGFYGRFGGRW